MMEKPLAVSVEPTPSASAGRPGAAASRDRQLRDDVVPEPRRDDWRDQGRSAPAARSARWSRWTGTRARRRSASQPEFLGWLTDPVKNGGGALFDFGCYGANLMTWLMDNERPRRGDRGDPAVQAGGLPARRRRGDDPRRVPGRAGDHPGVVELAVRPEGHRGLRRACLRRQRPGRMGCACACPGQTEETRTPAPLAADEHDSVSYLVSVVRGRVKPSGRSSLENNLVVTEILAAARTSAEQGRRVTLAVH